MVEPNLFTHARGELSQDAVLCWLLEWTGASCRSIDAETHAVARDFIAMLYRLHDHAPPECTSIRVMKQVDHADVVALVDEADLLVIEDKTDTTQHGNQLSRYRQALAQRHPGRRFIGIYLKTGDESSYAHARSDDWRVCTRKQLLAVLPRGARNVILRDFQAHLEKIDEAVESYATSTLDTKWSGRAWTGAFIALQARLPGAGWSYVANPSGGFMGLWLPERQLGDRRLKIQLEHERLVIKLIGKPATECRRVSKHVIARFPAELQLRKPDRLGSGNVVTIAESAVDWRRVAEDGRIDVEASAQWIAGADAALGDVGAVE